MLTQLADDTESRPTHVWEPAAAAPPQAPAPAESTPEAPAAPAPDAPKPEPKTILLESLDAAAIHDTSRVLLLTSTTSDTATALIEQARTARPDALFLVIQGAPPANILGVVAERLLGSLSRSAIARLVDPLIESAAAFILGPDLEASRPFLSKEALDETPAVSARLLVKRFAPALAAQLPEAPVDLVAALLALRAGAPEEATPLVAIARTIGLGALLRAIGALSSRARIGFVVAFDRNEATGAKAIADAAEKIAAYRGVAVLVTFVRSQWEVQREQLTAAERVTLEQRVVALDGTIAIAPPPPAPVAAPPPPAPEPPAAPRELPEHHVALSFSLADARRRARALLLARQREDAQKAAAAALPAGPAPSSPEAIPQAPTVEAPPAKAPEAALTPAPARAPRPRPARAEVREKHDPYDLPARRSSARPILTAALVVLMGGFSFSLVALVKREEPAGARSKAPPLRYDIRPTASRPTTPQPAPQAAAAKPVAPAPQRPVQPAAPVAPTPPPAAPTSGPAFAMSGQVIDEQGRILMDPNQPPAARSAAADALGRVSDPRALDQLVAATFVPESVTRSLAAEALAKRSEPQASAAAGRLLDDRDEAVRLAAIRALAKSPAGAPALSRGLWRETSPNVQAAMLTALGQVGEAGDLQVMLELSRRPAPIGDAAKRAARALATRVNVPLPAELAGTEPAVSGTAVPR